MGMDPGSLTFSSEYMDNRNWASFPLVFVLLCSFVQGDGSKCD